MLRNQPSARGAREPGTDLNTVVSPGRLWRAALEVITAVFQSTKPIAVSKRRTGMPGYPPAASWRRTQGRIPPWR